MITFTENMIYVKNEGEDARTFRYSMFFAMSINRRHRKLHLFGTRPESGEELQITVNDVTDEEYDGVLKLAKDHGFENLNMYPEEVEKDRSVWKIPNDIWEADEEKAPDSDSDD